jgi:hypothetical protein
VIVQTASQCLDETYRIHTEFYQRWGVSKFYGNRRAEHQTEAGRRGELRRLGKPESLINELEPMSCIGLTMRCLEQGFQAAGMATTWGRIYARLAQGNNFYGHELQLMLQDLGWQLVYWNPDPSKNESWDREDQRLNPLPRGRKWNPVWGGHALRFREVQTRGTYFKMPIDNALDLVGFGRQVPFSFQQVEFFVGIAHAGYHVFPGRRGDVIEAHSTRRLEAFDNLEFSQFNPLAPKGGPRWTRTEKYRSGVIAIPGARGTP